MSCSEKPHGLLENLYVNYVRSTRRVFFGGVFFWYWSLKLLSKHFLGWKKTLEAVGWYSDPESFLLKAVDSGMYNHIRPLMVTGALLASGAAACFVPLAASGLRVFSSSASSEFVVSSQHPMVVDATIFFFNILNVGLCAKDMSKTRTKYEV